MYAARPGKTETMTDWTTDAADTIERTVALVRERTIDPVHTITRAVVFGLLAVLVAAPALVLAALGAFRGLVVLYDLAGIGAWAAWLTLGGIFVIIGAFCWVKRNP